MPTDSRPMLEDGMPGRLGRHFAVEMPSRVAQDVDRRIQAAIAIAAKRAAGPRNRPGPRRRTVAILAAAVLLAAAAPAIKFFENWGEDFDRVFELSTPIDQSVVDHGYRVTVVRAYADPLYLRLAATAEDLEDRGWSEIGIGGPAITDDEGLPFDMSVGYYGQPSRTTSEGWLQFLVPPEAAVPGSRHLTVTFDRLMVRRAGPAPTLPNGEIDPDRARTTVAGKWSFDFDLKFLAGHATKPDVSATVGEVTVTLSELTVTPAVTTGRMTV